MDIQKRLSDVEKEFEQLKKDREVLTEHGRQLQQKMNELDTKLVQKQGALAKYGTITNNYAFYGKDATLSEGAITNNYGIWLEPRAIGATLNYGMVLAGDGAGSDIVFGAAQDAVNVSKDDTLVT